MTSEQMVEKLKLLLPGLIVQSFRLVVGGTLILYLGQKSVKRDDDRSPVRVWIESAWRLCCGDRMIIGSLDSPDLIMVELKRLCGIAVESVRLVGCLGDITMTFQCDLVIESFSQSVRDEQWQVRCSDGLRFGLRENLEFYETIEESDVLSDRLAQGETEKQGLKSSDSPPDGDENP